MKKTPSSYLNRLRRSPKIAPVEISQEDKNWEEQQAEEFKKASYAFRAFAGDHPGSRAHFMVPPAEPEESAASIEEESDEDSQPVIQQFGNQKLPFLEALRFRALLDSASEGLTVLGILTGELLQQKKAEGADADQANSRKDMKFLMDQQNKLEVIIEDLMVKRHDLRGISNKKRYLKNQANIAEVMQELKESTTGICTNLAEQPTVLGNILKIQRDRAGVQSVLDEAGRELQCQQTFVHLSEQVRDRLLAESELSEMRSKQQHTAAVLDQLKRDLVKEWNTYHRTLDKKNRAIQELTEQFKHKRKVLRLRLKYRKQNFLAAAESEDRTRNARIRDLEQKISDVCAEHAREKTVNARTNAFLQRQHDRMMEVQTQWNQKMETELEQKEIELADLTMKHEEAEESLSHNRNRWDLDQAKRWKKMEEIKQREREEAMRAKLKYVMSLAQAKIRLYWRIYLRKKAAKKKKGKGKKSKGKKTSNAGNRTDRTTTIRR